MNIHFEHFTTPSGEKRVSLSEAEFEHLEDILDAARIDEVQALYKQGKSEILTSDEVKDALSLPTPLAFWIKKRGIKQETLAKTVGISQSYISDLANGKKIGDPTLFLRLAKALNVQMEALIVDC
jgi:predicted XRE-type DNA-binding protein